MNEELDEELEKKKQTLIKFLNHNNIKFEKLSEDTQATILDLYLNDVKMPIINYLKLKAPNDIKDIALYDIKNKIEMITKTQAIKIYTKAFVESVEYFVTIPNTYKKKSIITLYFKSILEYYWEIGNHVKIVNPNRIKGAEKAVETKIRKLKDHINSLKISIPIIEKEKLHKKALSSFMNYAGYDFYVPPEDHRLLVNYIRHELTKYDDIIWDMWGKTGKEIGLSLLRNRIYNLISEKYPYLKEECIKQMQQRNCLNVN